MNFNCNGHNFTREIHRIFLNDDYQVMITLAPVNCAIAMENVTITKEEFEDIIQNVEIRKRFELD